MQAVDAVKAGASPEDDRIEFKREWPSPEKARQLAAAANQAHGDHVIYVIGIDESDGTVHPVTGTDPATWWAQFEARFDEVAPDLVRHINVNVSSEERVVALLFRTDRAPYVVKVTNAGAVEREVPIRSGTRTRSAKRHELMRLLLPSLSVPRLSTVAGTLELSDEAYFGEDDDGLRMFLNAEIYFEHAGHPCFLPLHAVRVDLICGDIRESGELIAHAPKLSQPGSALEIRRDGIRVSEPGTLHLGAVWHMPPTAEESAVKAASWEVLLNFPVSGTTKEASLRIRLGERKRAVTDPHGDVRYLWKSTSSF